LVPEDLKAERHTAFLHTFCKFGKALLFLIPLLAREVVVVDGFEAGVFDVGIDLRGGDAGMAQHHLNRSEVGTMV
jgi:hypothetical protein